MHIAMHPTMTGKCPEVALRQIPMNKKSNFANYTSFSTRIILIFYKSDEQTGRILLYFSKKASNYMRKIYLEFNY